MLGDDYSLAAAGDRGVEREIPTVPSHNLDDCYALVRCRGVAEAVDALNYSAESSAEAY